MNKEAEEKAQPRNGLQKKEIHEESRSRKLEAALEYTKIGWYIIPLCWPDAKGSCACPKKHQREKEVGKAPILGKDFQHFRATENQIRLWWEKWPKANLGVLLEPSGLMVVEVDSPKAFEEVQKLGIPKTLTNRSSKGYHYIFERPEDFPTTRSTKRGKSEAIDLLSSGYANLPPSTHQTGHIYRFDVGLPLAKAPTWVKWMLEERTLFKEPEAPRESQKPLTISTKLDKTEEERVEDALQYISAEHYDDWLHIGMALHWWDFAGDGGSSGRYLWDKWSRTSPKFDSKTQDTKWNSFKPGKGITLGTLFEMAKDNGWRPPIKEMKSSQTKESKKKLQQHIVPTSNTKSEEPEGSEISLPPFPVDVFPTVVQEIVHAYSNNVNSVVDFAGVYALAATAIALGPNWRIHSQSYLAEPRLWLAVVAPPGSAKSPVQNKILEPIHKQEEILRENWKKELEQWNAEDSKKERGARPLAQHVRVNDFNIDALSAVLARCPGGIILDIDEIKQLFALIDINYTSGKAKGWETFLGMWQGTNLDIIRKCSDPLHATKPFVVACGGTQPSILRSLGLTQGDGMAQRFLWSIPDIPRRVRGYGENIPDTMGALWNSLILSTFGKYSVTCQATEEAREYGDQILVKYNDQNYEFNDAKLEAYGALYAKAAEHLHRIIAALFGMDHIFTNENRCKIPVSVFMRANKLMDYFLAHSKRCIELMLAGESESVTHNKLREQDRKLLSILQILINQLEKDIYTTSEWSILIEKHTKTKINPKSLGRALKRLSSLSLSDIKITRSSGKNSDLRYWRIRAS